MSNDKVARIAERVEEMAHQVYGLPKDERSMRGAAEVAGMIEAISGVVFEDTEEPIMAKFKANESS